MWPRQKEKISDAKKINKISFSSVVALLAPNQQERTLNYPPIIKTWSQAQEARAGLLAVFFNIDLGIVWGLCVPWSLCTPSAQYRTCWVEEWDCYSVWEMFSLSYGKRGLVFYRANIARFLNEQFGVRLRHSECLKSPLELLQGKNNHCLMVLSCPVSKTVKVAFPKTRTTFRVKGRG